MKSLILALFLLVSMSVTASEIFGLTYEKTDGENLKFSTLKGKTILFVNVATRCGYTGQLDGLENLYKEFKDKNFLIVGIPSNDFGGQTPEGDKEVAKFCRLKYGVTFPLLSKTPVTGDKKPELIKILLNGGEEIAWNFEKFLVSKDGKIIERFKSAVTPDSVDLKKKIEANL